METVTKSKESYNVSSTKTCAVWMVNFPCATVTKSLKETIAGLIWMQSTKASSV